MDTLPKALNEIAEQFPHQAMVLLLEYKLKAQRIKLTKREVRDLANRILTEEAETISLPSRSALLA